MKKVGQRLLLSGLSLGGIVLISLLTWWGWILTSPLPFEVPLAKRWPWPVACTVRSCITSRYWYRYWQASQAYARTAGETEASEEAVLTTLLRQKMVAQAWVKRPVDKREVRRYRTEVLNLTDEKMAQEALGLSLDDYDQLVLEPLLQQEALRQQMAIENIGELWLKLAADRKAFVLLSDWRWDKQKAQVVEQ